MNSNNLYEKYTSTSSLVNDSDYSDSLNYIKVNYGKLLPANKAATILDVGCGYGKYIKAMVDLGYENCHGIDMSDEQIAYAKNVLNLKNIEKANALNWLENKSEVYDCIISIDVLEHLNTSDLIELGKKMYSALKPGGHLIFQVPNGMALLNPIIYGDLTHVRAFTAQSTRQFFLLSGLKPIGYFEIPPFIHGFKSLIQRIFWELFFKPFMKIWTRCVHGKLVGGDIYTANFIAVGKREH